MPIDATENRGPAFLPALWLLISIPVIFVSIRLYVRRHVVPDFLPTWGMEDYMVVLPVTLAVIGTVLISAAVMSTGLGQPIRFFADYEVKSVLRLTSFSVAFFTWSGCTARIAATVFLGRSITAPKRLKYLLWFIAIAQLCVTLAVFVSDVMQCRKILSGLNGDCYGQDEISWWPGLYISGTWNTISDSILTITMASTAWKIPYPGRGRIYQGLLVLVSLFAMTSVVVYTFKVAKVFLGGSDWIFDFLPVFIWSIFEQYIVITVPSLYAIRSLFINSMNGKSQRSSRAEMDTENNLSPVVEHSSLAVKQSSKTNYVPRRS